jgi:hypothetical protein
MLLFTAARRTDRSTWRCTTDIRARRQRQIQDGPSLIALTYYLAVERPR